MSTTDALTAGQLLQLEERIGSCDCMTKTPETQYHGVLCKYRVLVERDQLREENDRLQNTIRELENASAELVSKLGLANHLLREELQRVQDGLIRFLIPWRSNLPECWLQHLAELGPIKFDGIGFVVPNPDSALAKHAPEGRTA